MSLNRKKAFSTLGLSTLAKQQDIKKKFRELALQHHPDKNQGSQKSKQTFIQIKEAYDYLMTNQQPEVEVKFNEKTYTSTFQTTNKKSSSFFQQYKNDWFEDFLRQLLKKRQRQSQNKQNNFNYFYNSFNSRTKNTFSKSVQCFKCGKFGHMKRDCIYQQKDLRECWNCGQIGHIQYNCPYDQFYC